MQTTAQSLIYTLRSIDNLLDYGQSDQELLKQTENLEDFTEADESRLTLIRGDGLWPRIRTRRPGGWTTIWNGRK